MDRKRKKIAPGAKKRGGFTINKMFFVTSGINYRDFRNNLILNLELPNKINPSQITPKKVFSLIKKELREDPPRPTGPLSRCCISALFEQKRGSGTSLKRFFLRCFRDIGVNIFCPQ